MSGARLRCLAIALALVLSALTPFAPSASAITPADTLIVAAPFITTVDPAGNYPVEAGENMSLIYDTLVSYDRGGKIRPGLATSWQISPDSREYTFQLRRGVKFHDGSPLTAEAVKFSFDRMLKIGKEGMSSWRVFATVDSVSVLDLSTVKMTFSKPFPLFLEDLTLAPYSIINPEYVKAHSSSDDPYGQKWMATHEDGTGPFRLTEWVADQRMRFVKTADYWAGGAKRTSAVGKVLILAVPSPETRRIMLERGEADVTTGLTSEMLDELSKSSGIVVDAVPDFAITYLGMDVRSKPFDDVRVRKAVNYAINTNEIIAKALKGRAKRLYTLNPEGTFAFDASVFQYSYDPVQAKKLLAEAGYGNGFTTRLLYAPQRSADFDDVATLIQGYLAQVGVQAKIEKMTIDAQIAQQAKGNYGLSLMIWHSPPDPEYFAGWLYDAKRGGDGWTAAYWNDSDALKWVADARSTTDISQRRSLYVKLDKRAIDQAVYVLLYQPEKVFVMRRGLKSFYYRSFVGIYAWDVRKTE